MTELDNRESEAANERNGSYLQDQSPPGPEEHLLLEDSDSDTRIAAKLRLQGIHIGAGLIAPRVFWPALIIIVAVTLTAILAPTFTEVTLQALQTWIVETLGWYYVLVVACLFCSPWESASRSMARSRWAGTATGQNSVC